MASWCGSTLSFCGEQETQGRRCGENMKQNWEGNRRIWEHRGEKLGEGRPLVDLRGNGPLSSSLDRLVKTEVIPAAYTGRVRAHDHGVGVTHGCRSPGCKVVLPHCEPHGHPERKEQ